MAERIPAIGGASEAIANPKPKGKATKETTKPEKIFAGSNAKEEGKRSRGKEAEKVTSGN